MTGVIRPSSVRLSTAAATEDGAGDEVRTRDIQLGRLTLCQLSYSRPPAEDTPDVSHQPEPLPRLMSLAHGLAGMYASGP